MEYIRKGAADAFLDILSQASKSMPSAGITDTEELSKLSINIEQTLYEEFNTDPLSDTSDIGFPYRNAYQRLVQLLQRDEEKTRSLITGAVTSKEVTNEVANVQMRDAELMSQLVRNLGVRPEAVKDEFLDWKKGIVPDAIKRNGKLQVATAPKARPTVAEVVKEEKAVPPLWTTYAEECRVANWQWYVSYRLDLTYTLLQISWHNGSTKRIGYMEHFSPEGRTWPVRLSQVKARSLNRVPALELAVDYRNSYNADRFCNNYVLWKRQRGLADQDSLNVDLIPEAGCVLTEFISLKTWFVFPVWLSSKCVLVAIACFQQLLNLNRESLDISGISTQPHMRLHTGLQPYHQHTSLTYIFLQYFSPTQLMMSVLDQREVDHSDFGIRRHASIYNRWYDIAPYEKPI